MQPRLKILEALAASGLRSIRYGLEIPRVGTVVANDLSKDAYHSMCRNIEHNQVGGVVTPSWREARSAVVASEKMYNLLTSICLKQRKRRVNQL